MLKKVMKSMKKAMKSMRKKVMKSMPQQYFQIMLQNMGPSLTFQMIVELKNYRLTMLMKTPLLLEKKHL